jgi:hypothetical protein
MSQQRATVVGLVGVELAPLRRCLERGSRAWCLVEGVLMDKQILENNIKGLKKARDACRSQLDIGAMKELDDAISKLEQLRDHHPSAAEAQQHKLRILQAIAAVVVIVTNIRDWL